MRNRSILLTSSAFSRIRLKGLMFEIIDLKHNWVGTHLAPQHVHTAQHVKDALIMRMMYKKQLVTTAVIPASIPDEYILALFQSSNKLQVSK